jgi:SAM-dependent methyltransferase
MNNLPLDGIEHSSFRDSSGFVFYYNDSVYRYIDTSYRDNYKCFLESGLYKHLIEDELIIPHSETDLKNERRGFVNFYRENIVKNLPDSFKQYKIIKLEMLPFISYPYEWCFGQLKDAALLTLKIQKKALQHGMTLKDCSAFNIQFRGSHPLFIDTLSFEKYSEGKPWTPYRQFCSHFLAPLSLMVYTDNNMNKLLSNYLDGIPLPLANKLLPVRSNLNLSLYSHIKLHAKGERFFSKKRISQNRFTVGKYGVLGLVESLESAVKSLKLKNSRSQWNSYYDRIDYSPAAFVHKKEIISDLLKVIKPSKLLDIGSNTGTFSFIAQSRADSVVSIDCDHLSIEKNYYELREKKILNILPLVIDIASPTPGLGWENKERCSFIWRLSVDTILALALIHHLFVSFNMPFYKIAELFRSICENLIIEFIPPDDVNFKILIENTMKDCSGYTVDNFKKEFRTFFYFRSEIVIRDSVRSIFYLQKKS